MAGPTRIFCYPRIYMLSGVGDSFSVTNIHTKPLFPIQSFFMCLKFIATDRCRTSYENSVSQFVSPQHCRGSFDNIDIDMNVEVQILCIKYIWSLRKTNGRCRQCGRPGQAYTRTLKTRQKLLSKISTALGYRRNILFITYSRSVTGKEFVLNSNLRPTIVFRVIYGPQKQKKTLLAMINLIDLQIRDS